MKLYLDASIIVALLTNDIFTSRADIYIRSQTPILIVSDFAGVEFASVIARRVRTREVTQQTAQITFLEFDTWSTRNTEYVETTTADVTAAARALRRLDMTLRTADALNIAIAQRVNATLMTFDQKMAIAAQTLGVDVAPAWRPVTAVSAVASGPPGPGPVRGYPSPIGKNPPAAAGFRRARHPGKAVPAAIP